MPETQTPQRNFVDVGIVCSHFEESLHFYRDLLGLEVALDIQIPASVAVGAKLAPRPFRQVRLKAGETLIKLMEIKEPPPRRSSGCSGRPPAVDVSDSPWRTAARPGHSGL